MHEVERGLDLVGAIGLGTDDLDLVLRVPANLRLTIDDLRLSDASPIVNRKSEIANPLVVIHPGCTMPARTYPWELYAQVLLGSSEFLFVD